MSSIQPRKQRKAWYDAPLHKRRKQMASHLAEDLLLKYNVRRTPVVTGDEVRILRGDHKGETGKVVRVETKDRKVVVEGITHKKADGTDVAMPLDPSNLLITRLNLEDKRRRAKIGEEAPKKSAKTPSEAGKSGSKEAPKKTPSEAGKSASGKKASKTAAKTAAKTAKAPSEAGKSASGKKAPAKEVAPAGQTEPAKEEAPAGQTEPAKEEAPAGQTEPGKEAAPAAQTEPAKEDPDAAKEAS